jgi:outer membrane protein assembly factor BamB
MAGSPAVLNGVVYIGSGTAQGSSERITMSARPILGLDAETGKEVWQSQGPGPQGYAAIATDGNHLFAGLNGSTDGAYAVGTGARAWEAKGGHQNRQFMSLTVAEGMVYIPTAMRGAVMAVHADGTTQWITAMLDGQLDIELNQGGKFGFECLTDVAVAHGLVLAGNNDGKLHAFAAADGAKVWQFPTAGKVQSSPSVAGGLVYFGSWDGHLYAVAAKTGALQWNFAAGARIISSPWPGNGAIYFGCDDGGVYALK